MSKSVITVTCYECGTDRQMVAHLSTMMQVWANSEGLLCCGVQTRFTYWEPIKED